MLHHVVSEQCTSSVVVHNFFSDDESILHTFFERPGFFPILDKCSFLDELKEGYTDKL